MFEIIKIATFLSMAVNIYSLILYITVMVFKYDKASITSMADVIIFSNTIFWILIFVSVYFDIS